MRYSKVRHGAWSALVLFFLAPFVGEFLLGNLPVTELPGIVLLATMYGGGAVLIRETARRFGRGWPTMVTLAAAYALIEEGPIDQMLYNPAYLGYDSFAGLANIPGLDISGTLLQGTLSVHTVWSICVPIALMEGFMPDARKPWLGRFGLTVTALVYVAGSAFLAVQQYYEFEFIASPTQLAVSVAVIIILIVVAFYIGRKTPPLAGRPAPRPWSLGLFGFVVPGVFWLEQTFIPERHDVVQWCSIAAWAVLAIATIALCVRWSRGRGWNTAHVSALASGALLSYAWLGFLTPSAVPVSPEVKYTGNAIFASIGIAIVVGSWIVQKRRMSAVTSTEAPLSASAVD